MNTPMQPTATIGTGNPGGVRHAWQRARRKAALQALLLALPLLVFLLATFIAPIASLLARSVQNPEVRGSMPQLTVALRAWDGNGVPGEPVFAALGQGLRQSAEAGELGNIARRMNFYQPEFRSLLMKTARETRSQTPDAWKPALIQMDPRWGENETWRLLKRAATSPTPDYLLNAIDAQIAPDGSVTPVPADSAVYRAAFVRTIQISATVTLLCLLLGYPVAYLLATLPPKQGNRLMLFVIVPIRIPSVATETA